MQEKILAKSTTYNVKKLFGIILLIGIAISLLCGLIAVCDMCDNNIEFYNQHVHQNYHGDYCYNKSGKLDCEYMAYKTLFGYLWDYCNDYFMDAFLIVLLGAVISVALSSLVYFWLKSYELTITNKRVYGKIAWGKRVDLPVDSISSTATIRLLKGVSVATSSGKISFLAIKNADEIYGVVNNLLVERQKEKAKEAAPVVVTQSDEADQLKKYKDLLDSGVISQEEFDAKKKQLLGL